MNLLGKEKVQQKTGLSDSTIWRLERAGAFPERLNITPSRVGWAEEEIDEWIASRPRGICNREIGKGVPA